MTDGRNVHYINKPKLVNLIEEKFYNSNLINLIEGMHSLKVQRYMVQNLNTKKHTLFPRELTTKPLTYNLGKLRVKE